MEIFVAAQPVLDRACKTIAYELLHRTNIGQNFYDYDDEDLATESVIVDAFNTIGIQHLTNGKPALINFSKKMLFGPLLSVLPKEQLIIELMETIVPTDDFIERCKSLKASGYTLALDDFLYSPEYEPLVGIADIIKVDFLRLSEDEIIRIVNRFKGRARLLAEKIETMEAFDRAKEMGFTYFQGFFFSKPVIHKTADISPLKLSLLELIGVVTREEVDFNKIAEIVSRDVSLSFRLLRLINSAYFGLPKRITSLKHAATMLGQTELSRWVTLMSLRDIGADRPTELLRMSMVRARFLETVAKKLPDYARQSQELFLTGLLSLLDVLTETPFPELLADMSLHPNITNALMGRDDSPYSPFLKISVAYEKGIWDNIIEMSNVYNINPVDMMSCYLDAVKWCNSAYSGML